MYPTNIPIYCWAVLLFLAVWPPYISEVHRIVKHMLVVMTSRRIKNQMKWKKGVIFNLWKHFQATFVPKPLPVNVNTVWMDYPVAVLAAKSGLGDTITLVVWNNRLLCGVPTRRHSTPSWALRAASVLAIVLAKGQRTPLHFPTRMANKARAWLSARLLSEAHNIVTQYQSQPVSSDKSMMGKGTHLEHLLHFIDTPSFFFFWWSTLSESQRLRSLLLKDALRRSSA